MDAATPPVSTRKPGRGDGLRLVPARIKSLREEAGLTQEQAGQAVHRILNPDGPRTSEHTQLVTYQRVERTGETSRRYADALARVFGTTVPVLQGDAPDEGPTLAQRVAAQLRAQFAGCASAELRNALSRAEADSADSDPLERLADDLAAEIEDAHLSQRRGEIERLSRITGWSDRDLLNAGTQLGHWMVLSGLGRVSQVSTGVAWALHQLEEQCEEALGFLGDDPEAIVSEDLPWVRIELTSPRWSNSGRRRLIFSAVRCVPTSRGMEWRNPTWRDRFLLEMFLPQWAFTHVNFVTWQGKKFPEDILRLRLVLERHAEGEKWDQLALLDGDLRDQTPEMLEDFRRWRSRHTVVLEWLTADLWDRLLPHLADWAPEYWRIEPGAASIGVSLDTLKLPYAVLRDVDPKQWRVHLRIRLVEEVGEELRSAPWRDGDVATAAAALSGRLERLREEVAIGPPRPPRWLRG